MTRSYIPSQQMTKCTSSSSTTLNMIAIVIYYAQVWIKMVLEWIRFNADVQVSILFRSVITTGAMLSLIDPLWEGVNSTEELSLS